MKNHEKAGNDKNNEFFKGFNKSAVITREFMTEVISEIATPYGSQ